MLNEKIGSFVDGVFLVFPFIEDHGPTFCAGLLIGVFLGCLIPLFTFACFKIDERIEKKFSEDKRGDDR